MRPTIISLLGLTVSFISPVIFAQDLTSDYSKYPTELEEHAIISSDGLTYSVDQKIPIYELGENIKNSEFSLGKENISPSMLRSAGVILNKDNRLTKNDYVNLSNLPTPNIIGDLDSRSNADTNRIIGWDMRQRLYTTNYPAKSNVLITFNGGRCSGTLIGSDTVVTAGHCLYNSGWSSGIKVFAGANGLSTPYGYCTASRLYTVVGWAYMRKEEYDYGAIKLNCTVGNIVGWYGFTTENPYNQASIIQGYPGDKFLEQWTSSDKVRATSSRQIFYPNDTTGGMSGSGVWYDRLGPYLIGIHGYGTHGFFFSKHARYNHGIRINIPVFYNLLNWRNS